MSKTIPRHGGRISVLAGVALALLVIWLTASSCDEDPSETASQADRPVAEPSRKSTPDPTASERAAAERAVLTAYRRMQDSITAAYANPTRPHRDLQQYAADKALAEIYETLYFYEKNGIVLRGEPTISPRVTSVDLDGIPRVATIVDCFDQRNWVPVDAKTGESVSAPGQNHRYVITSVARELEGRWYIVRSTPDRSRKC
jgi:hypothetical protein